MKKTLLFLCIGIIVYACNQPTRQIARGPMAKNGMVSTAHPYATEVGLEILKKGGNAFDASIAVQFALAVVYPRAGNIGGGGLMVSRTADGAFQALDFREKAPGLAFEEMYLDEEGEIIPKLSLAGDLASGVPGSVAGMWQIHQKFGTLSWEDLIQPAIDMAENGVALTKGEAESLNRFAEHFNENNEEITSFEAKDTWKLGELFVQKELAETLKRIRDNGPDGFYKGKTADLIVEQMERGGGIISHTDLEAYEAIWRDPIEATYKNFRVVSMPPPSSGGIAILQMLKGSEYFDWQAAGHNSAAAIHYMTELMRRVYADRATYLGDPDFYNVPTEMLLDTTYLKNRFSDIKSDIKTPSEEIKAGEVASIESFETTHFSVTDKMGNAVAITTTINGAYGCKVIVKGAGFFLNNEMDDFAIKPGVPNQFGLVGAEANAVQPGKRMLSSMTPTIVEKDGALFAVVGTPGGSTIITAVYQTVMNILEFDMTMQEAVNAKKIHAQWLPDLVYVEEGGLDPEIVKELESMGHELKTSPILGKMNCIRIGDDGMMEGAADTVRSEGTSLGLP
ncbi:MAG: gamma-glutamyltransferase [Cyclobacteriaceae bacterium]